MEDKLRHIAFMIYVIATMVFLIWSKVNNDPTVVIAAAFCAIMALTETLVGLSAAKWIKSRFVKDKKVNTTEKLNN